jgi:hypothetical protein
MKKLITNLEKELNGEHSFLPQEVEAQIRKEIANAGVAVSQYGGWYRCIAVYLLLSRLDDLLAVKGMGDSRSVAPVVQKLRNKALQESLGTFGLELPARYARTSSSTGRKRVSIPREQKLVETLLDALPTF